jgi:hypothetical protein
MPLENPVDARRGQRPVATSEDGLWSAPDPHFGEPGEQPGSEVDGQDGGPGAPGAPDGDHDAPSLHLDRRGAEAGNLAGAQAGGNQSEDGSVAQPHGQT